MRRGVRNEHHHFAGIRSPIHIDRLRQCSGHRLWPISTARSIQRRQIFVHLADVGREAKVLGDVRMILRGVVPESDEPDAEVFRALELARLKYMCADRLDVLRRGGDVRSLAAGAILHENEVPTQ